MTASTLPFAARAAGLVGSVIDSSTSLLHKQSHDIVRLAMGSPASEAVPSDILAGIAATELRAPDAYDYAATEGDPPLQRGFDLQTPAGVRKLRSEVHAFDGGLARYIVLLRERTTRDDAYRAHVKASECHGNRHLIANLVHDAKGPLNNIHLTLALLTSTIGRMDPAIDPRGRAPLSVREPRRRCDGATAR